MKEPLTAVGGVLGAILWLNGCVASAAETSAVRDSAGIEIVTHPAASIANAPVWMVDTAAALWTIGGGDEPDQDLDNISCATWLDDGAWVCHQNPNEMRRYDHTGRLTARFGRKGMGPGEFQRIQLLAVRGDTFDLWDESLARLTTYSTNGQLLDEPWWLALDPPEERDGLAPALQLDWLWA